MDLNTYYTLIQFLTTRSMPTHLDTQQRASIKWKSRYFIVLDDHLYKKNKDNPNRPIRVAKESEIEDILYHMHSDPLVGHFSVNEMYRRGKNHRTEPLHPIKVGQPFDKIGMDIVGPLPKTKNGNMYIVVATEYLIKWPEARAISNAKASSDDWDLYLSSVLFAYRTKCHSTTQHEPFYLMYGHDAVLPIEFAVSTMQSKCAEENPQDDLLNHIHTLTGKVVVDRLETQDNICKAQQKQKKQHDEDLHIMQYKIGDLVLLYQSQLRGKQKLQERWKGPYYVHEVLGNGAYKLHTIEGKILKVPVNSEQLKFIEEKFDAINIAIERANQIDDRILMLFYLGQLLESKNKESANHDSHDNSDTNIGQDNGSSNEVSSDKNQEGNSEKNIYDKIIRIAENSLAKNSSSNEKDKFIELLKEFCTRQIIEESDEIANKSDNTGEESASPNEIVEMKQKALSITRAKRKQIENEVNEVVNTKKKVQKQNKSKKNCSL
ncbi:uncharacterized protein LOC109147323 [Rhizophagus clarus]|uniref:Uncharacterized protein LOC109147323 n=1 Tax=Rhizophagus clarus TaxID=94130 RepID=A0A8H3MDL1_9GLOM|nr:uncharacterized protein LOC109147323 [Rhizophagus clarus]